MKDDVSRRQISKLVARIRDLEEIVAQIENEARAGKD